MHSWLAAVLDERIAAAAPMIGVQNFQWAIDHDQVMGRVSSLPALFAAAAWDLGSPLPSPAVASAVWARLLPRLLPPPAADADTAAGAAGAAALPSAAAAAPVAAAFYDAPASLPCIAPRALLVANGERDPRCPLTGVREAVVGAMAAYDAAGERMGVYARVVCGEGASARASVCLPVHRPTPAIL
jgi:hypothetical protein